MKMTTWIKPNVTIAKSIWCDIWTELHKNRPSCMATDSLSAAGANYLMIKNVLTAPLTNCI